MIFMLVALVIIVWGSDREMREMVLSKILKKHRDTK